MKVNPELLGQSLEIMLLGMAGIFIVLTVLLLAVKVLLKIFPEKIEKKELKSTNTDTIENVTALPKKEDDELTCAIIGAISEDMKLPLNSFKITKISEV